MGITVDSICSLSSLALSPNPFLLLSYHEALYKFLKPFIHHFFQKKIHCLALNFYSNFSHKPISFLYKLIFSSPLFKRNPILSINNAISLVQTELRVYLSGETIV